MSVDFSKIEIPSDIPAKIRGQSLDAGAAAQRDSNLEFLQQQHSAAVANLTALHGKFDGKQDHDISVVSASSRAMNAIVSMVTGQPPMNMNRSSSRGR